MEKGLGDAVEVLGGTLGLELLLVVGAVLNVVFLPFRFVRALVSPSGSIVTLFDISSLLGSL